MGTASSLLENGEIKKSYSSDDFLFQRDPSRRHTGLRRSSSRHLFIAEDRFRDIQMHVSSIHIFHSNLTWAWWPFRYDLFMVLGERWQWVFYSIDASVNDAIFWHRASNIPQPNPNDIGSMAEDEATLSVNPPPEGVKVSFILLILQEIFN